jgi:hypothetical protein
MIMEVIDALTKNKYGTQEYRNSYYYDWLCASCGARYSEEFKEPTEGIAVSKGHHGYAKDNEVLTHLNTKAGPITIILRKTQPLDE